MNTPKPMQGTWTLTAPDGRTWQADAPLRCVAAESRERVPATVALKRIYAAADSTPDPLYEAAQQALEALEYHQAQTRPIEKTTNAIAALRSTLGVEGQQP